MLEAFVRKSTESALRKPYATEHESETQPSMKPLIALSSQFERDPDRFSLRAPYVSAIERAGGVPLVVPAGMDAEDLGDALAPCDGLLIPGGDDIDPALYGEARIAASDEPVSLRDEAEPLLLRWCRERGMPFLGICRGLQMANVALGGTLTQDVSLRDATTLRHWQHEPYETPSHLVKVLPHTLLADILGERPLPVNSMHHQAIDRLAPDLAAAAIAEDGLVEAACLPGHPFFLGVQWHPEYRIEDERASHLLLQAFVQAATRYRSARHGRCA